jgi:hypothetical protein
LLRRTEGKSNPSCNERGLWNKIAHALGMPVDRVAAVAKLLEYFR